MVSIAEAKKLAEQQRKAIQEQKKKLEERKREAEKIRFETTQQKLRGQTARGRPTGKSALQLRAERRSEIRNIEQQRSSALSEVKKGFEQIKGYEGELTSYEKEIQKAEEKQAAAAKEAAEWEKAQQLVFANKGYAARGDDSLYAKVRAIEKGQEKAYQAQQLEIADLKKAGFSVQNLEPITGEKGLQVFGGDVSKLPEYLQKKLEIKTIETPAETLQPITSQSKLGGATPFVSGLATPIRDSSGTLLGFDDPLRRMSIVATPQQVTLDRITGGKFYQASVPTQKQVPGGLFPFVSAQSIDLKNIKDSGKQDVVGLQSGVSSRGYSGDDRGIRDSSYNGDSDSGWFSNIIRGFKEGEKEKREKQILNIGNQSFTQVAARPEQLGSISSEQQSIVFDASKVKSKGFLSSSADYFFPKTNIPYSPPESVLGGESFNIWKSPIYAGRIIEKSKPIQNVLGWMKGKTPSAYETITQRSVRGFTPELVSSTTAFAFFSPVMTTGATGVFKKKLKLKGRFDELGKELDAATTTAAVSKVEKDLLSKTTAKEQWEYILKLSKNANTEEKKAGLRILIQDLQEKGILKPLPVTETITSKGAGGIVADVPKMDTKVLSFTGGVVSEPKDFSKQISETKFEMFPLVSGQTTNQQQDLFQESKSRQDVFFKAIKKVKQRQRQEQKQAQIQKSALAQVLGLKQSTAQKQTQRQVQRQRTRQQIRPRTPTTPKIPKKFTFFDIPETKQKTIKSAIGKMASFDIFGRRFGQDIKIGEARTKKEAGSILKGFLKGTLGRSGFVKKGEEILDFGELDLGMEFRPSKKSSKRVVQKARFSLGTFPERKEIQRARKSSKKRGKKIKWLS